MNEGSLNLLNLANDIERHYLLKKNIKEFVYFENSIESVIKAKDFKIFKEELFLLISFLRNSEWKYAENMYKWFSSVTDEQLQEMGVII